MFYVEFPEKYMLKMLVSCGKYSEKCDIFHNNCLVIRDNSLKLTVVDTIRNTKSIFTFDELITRLSSLIMVNCCIYTKNGAVGVCILRLGASSEFWNFVMSINAAKLKSLSSGYDNKFDSDSRRYIKSIKDGKIPYLRLCLDSYFTTEGILYYNCEEIKEINFEEYMVYYVGNDGKSIVLYTNVYPKPYRHSPQLLYISNSHIVARKDIEDYDLSLTKKQISEEVTKFLCSMQI